MAKVSGVVEVVMPNKFDKEKIALKVEGDDRWFNQKREWMDLVPERGDTVEFDDGGAKYIKFLKVISEGGGGDSAPAPKKGGFKKTFKDNTLGIELGHAANNAVAIAIAQGDFSIDNIESITRDFYGMMKSLREEYEGGKVEAEPVKKVEPAKDVSVEDDDPF
jgi:hypothetical protein